jgi:serine/threonine protein kinase
MRSRLRVGRYRLVERLGGGQVAEVWRARGPLGREVVVKRLLPHLAHAGQDADEAHRLFARECRVHAALRHPNLVRTRAVATAAGPLLVMEHVAGPTLQALLRWRWREPPIGLIAHVAAEVCDALAYLHAGDVASGRPPLVHRDVTPSNVLIGRDGAVKLIDLGIALPLDDPDYTRTQPGMIKGKPEFVAPERRAGAAGGPEADLFSVGVMLQVALTGELPRAGAVLPATELSELCRAAQAERPAERPTASALARALRGLADGRGYGARELAAEIAARFAAEQSQSATRTLPGSAAASRGRRAWIGAAAAVVIAAAIATGWIHHRARLATPAGIANGALMPPPTVALPATATAPRPSDVGAVPEATSRVAPVAAPPVATAVENVAPAATSRSTSRSATAPGPRRRVRRPTTRSSPAANETLLGKSLVDPFQRQDSANNPK